MASTKQVIRVKMMIHLNRTRQADSRRRMAKKISQGTRGEAMTRGRIECVLVDGKFLTLHFAYALFIIICQNYGQVLTYTRKNYFPCRCTCGNCSRDLLANISECYCCKELEGNLEALTSHIVLAELQEGHVLNCDNNSLSHSLKFRP